MKNKIILLLFVAGIGFSSCSTSYRNSQTPDDVYFSPLKDMTYANEQKDEHNYIDPEEREIRMAAHDQRWRNLDYYYNYDNYYNPYYYGYGSGYGYYYNPFYYPYPVYAPVIWSNPKNHTPRMANLGAFQQPQTITVKDPKLGTTQTIKNTSRYNNSNMRNGNTRTIFSSGNTNSSTENNTRSYNPSSSGRVSSGSSNSSSTPVSRPPRH